jgi:carboxymethylenebutenolidase
MDERTLQVDTPDGTMETFLAMPDSDGPFPPVVLYMDIWGMREQLRAGARTVASEGFACAAPSLYYREGNVHFDRRHPDGRTKSIAILDDADRQKMLDYNKHLTDDMVISDTGALIDHLRTIDKVSKGYAGCFGYCMGGRHVMKVAAAHPDVFRATASYHGTYLATDQADSPHLGAKDIKGEVYCGYGEEDPFTPREVIEKVRAAFGDSDAVLHENLHSATKHGYAIPDRDVFNQAASNADWVVVYDMFRRLL